VVETQSNPTFLANVLDQLGQKDNEVGVPMRKADEEVVHFNIWDATISQTAVLYKVLRKIQEWMEWEAVGQNTKWLPLRLMFCGAAGMD
jgi:hypothetical protein